jgi:ribonuclease-3
MDYVELAKRLGHEWTDIGRLVDAFFHSSWANEQVPRAESNERLEFLGDSVLDLLSAEFLMVKMPNDREGKLSQARAQIVCESNLAEMAKKLELGELLLVGKGADYIRRVPGVLADTMEAIIGAAYQDGGITAARQVVQASGVFRWG